MNLVPATLDAGQKQQLFLNRGRQGQQVHHLRDASPAHAPQPSQLGIVGHFTATDQLFEAQGQGHQPRDARHAGGWGSGGRLLRPGSYRLAAAGATAAEVYRTLDGQWQVHGILPFGAASPASVWKPASEKRIDSFLWA